MDVLASVPGRTAVAVHPLMDTGARSLDGQTVCATDVRGVATGWLAEAITSRGGIYTVLSPERHDRIMTYVLALTHQALLGFVTAVADSGLDLTGELWATRTPLFEALLGLAVSVLEENQELTLAHVQASLHGDRAAERLARAAASVHGALGSREQFQHRIAATRDRFSGALFDTVRTTAAATLSAGQSKRALLARVRRLGGLVGLHPTGRPDKLRVGRLVDLTPVHLVLEELLIGPKGSAALLHGPRRPQRQAAGTPRQGRPHPVRHRARRGALGRRTRGRPGLVAGLPAPRHPLPGARIGGRRGRRVGGARAARRRGRRPSLRGGAHRPAGGGDPHRDPCRPRPGRDHRTAPPGRRGGLRLAARGGPAAAVETWSWRCAIWVPPGTFSENAARQFAVGLAGAGQHDVRIGPADSFDDVLEATRAGGLGVLPITSSASGLVSRAAGALLELRRRPGRRRRGRRGGALRRLRGRSGGAGRTARARRCSATRRPWRSARTSSPAGDSTRSPAPRPPTRCTGCARCAARRSRSRRRGPRPTTRSSTWSSARSTTSPGRSPGS